VFLYLASVCPSIWLIELDKLETRLEQKEKMGEVSGGFEANGPGPVDPQTNQLNLRYQCGAYIQTRGSICSVIERSLLKMGVIKLRNGKWEYVGR
jgi:hypothetical protein